MHCQQNRPDQIQHPVDIRQNLIVPKPQDAKALSLKKERSVMVILRIVHMLRAIGLDHHLALKADEIDDEWSNPHLMPKLAAFNLAIAEILPEPFLGFGRGFAKRLAALGDLIVLWRLHYPHPPIAVQRAPPSPQKGEGFYARVISGASSCFMPMT